MQKHRLFRCLSISVVGIMLAGLMMGAEPGCESAKDQVSQSGAKQATLSSIPVNSKSNTCEQQNILDRIKVTTDPTKVMWIHLIGLDGKIVKRMPVRNKITSSGKRLEPKHAVTNKMNETVPPGYNGWFTDELIQPDGTYGDSDNYVYWFDPTGRYHQWGTAGGLGYLVTDYPIDLENPMDAVTGMYNASEAATRWQQQQEEKLKSQEKH